MTVLCVSTERRKKPKTETNDTLGWTISDTDVTYIRPVVQLIMRSGGLSLHEAALPFKVCRQHLHVPVYVIMQKPDNMMDIYDISKILQLLESTHGSGITIGVKVWFVGV